MIITCIYLQYDKQPLILYKCKYIQNILLYVVGWFQFYCENIDVNYEKFNIVCLSKHLHVIVNFSKNKMTMQLHFLYFFALKPIKNIKTVCLKFL